jgi:hypothetical protein
MPIFPEARKHFSILRNGEDYRSLAKRDYVRASGKIVRVQPAAIGNVLDICREEDYNTAKYLA